MVINLAWWNGAGGSNWGDAISPVIAAQISGGRKINYVSPSDPSETFRYYSVGSIIPPSSPASEIWGSGCMHDAQHVQHRPKKIHAVRGPLTRQVFLRSGIECPEVYGDPALLYPRFYRPQIKKTHRLGIVPHYIDSQHSWVQKIRAKEGAKVINILGGINHVVDEILSCECIVSSSLHGLIAADAYGIPALWIELSDKVAGGGFKFRDYFMSIGRSERDPIVISKQGLEDFSFHEQRLEVDLDALYAACPYQESKCVPIKS